MKRVPTHVVKERTREVSALFRSYTTHGGLLHTEQTVLVSDVASDKRHLVGHTKGYVQVLLLPPERGVCYCLSVTACLLLSVCYCLSVTVCLLLSVTVCCRCCCRRTPR